MEYPGSNISMGKYSLKPVNTEGKMIGMTHTDQGIKIPKSYTTESNRVFNIFRGFRRMGYVAIVPITDTEMDNYTKDYTIININSPISLASYDIQELLLNKKLKKSAMDNAFKDKEIVIDLRSEERFSQGIFDKEIGIVQTIQINTSEMNIFLDSYNDFKEQYKIGIDLYEGKEFTTCYLYKPLNDIAREYIKTTKLDQQEGRRAQTPNCEHFILRRKGTQKKTKTEALKSYVKDQQKKIQERIYLEESTEENKNQKAKDIYTLYKHNPIDKAKPILYTVLGNPEIMKFSYNDVKIKSNPAKNLIPIDNNKNKVRDLKHMWYPAFTNVNTDDQIALNNQAPERINKAIQYKKKKIKYYNKHQYNANLKSYQANDDYLQILYNLKY